MEMKAPNITSGNIDEAFETLYRYQKTEGYERTFCLDEGVIRRFASFQQFATSEVMRGEGILLRTGKTVWGNGFDQLRYDRKACLWLRFRWDTGWRTAEEIFPHEVAGLIAEDIATSIVRPDVYQHWALVPIVASRLRSRIEQTVIMYMEECEISPEEFQVLVRRSI
jgi:hypothetical protein